MRWGDMDCVWEPEDVRKLHMELMGKRALIREIMKSGVEKWACCDVISVNSKGVSCNLWLLSEVMVPFSQ